MQENDSNFNSKVVNSNQAGIHERLEDIVSKHIRSEYKKPYQQHNLEAFQQLLNKKEQFPNSELICDSCCGTGLSTINLALQNPSSLVIGIDQSAHRLNKNKVNLPDNLLLLQANCEDIWRLCLDHSLTFHSHYILYPNPWPKSVHLKRRWHGHPVFPYLKDFAQTTTLRSNWKTYLDEFNTAWHLLTQNDSSVESLIIDEPITLFERKYAGSGQTLYELVVNSSPKQR